MAHISSLGPRPLLKMKMGNNLDFNGIGISKSMAGHGYGFGYGCLHSSSPVFNSELSSAPEQSFIIGVAGGSASGKTTFCDMILQLLDDDRDSFYRGLTPDELDHVTDYNFDHPDALDMNELHYCLEKLKMWQSYNVPSYDFTTHQCRVDCFREVNAPKIVIVEGILVFHDARVRDLMDLKIYIDADENVRFAHRIKRDMVSRGRSVDSILKQYDRFVIPAYYDFILPSKIYADVIIPFGRYNHVGINLMVQQIIARLGPK